MKEIWKDIENYEGYYQVSNLGRVKGLKRNIIRKPILNKSRGYYQIMLCKDGIYKQFYIHRLVAEAFISNPENLPCINHKDENKQNNSVDNLEWCSWSYNNNYGTKIQRVSEKLSTPLIQLSVEGDFIKLHQGLSAAAKEFNGDVSTICNAYKGRNNTAYGYCWCSIDEYEKYFRVE